MTDTLVIDVDYDISRAEAKQNRLQAEYEEQLAKLDRQRKKVAEITAEAARLTKEAQKREAALAKQGEWTEKEGEEMDALLAKVAQVNAEREKQQATLKTQEARLRQIGQRITENQTKTQAGTAATESGTSAMGKFANRIAGLAKRVFIFSLITKAFRALRSEVADYIKQDAAMSASLGKVQTNLATIRTTLLEGLRPAIQFILNGLAYVTNIVSQVLANALGKDLATMQKLGQATKKVGQEAKKALAAFDILQTAQSGGGADSETAGAGAAAGPDFPKLTKDALIKIAALSGLALFGLGLLLTLTGVNIPIGLALIAAGAALFASALIPNWSNMEDKTRKSLAKILLIVSAFLVVIGLILILTGVGIPLGLGLLLAGVAVFATAVALHESKMGDTVQSGLKKILVVAGLSLLALGLILVITGVGLPIGLGLMLAGAAALYGAYRMDPQNFVQNVKDTIAQIMDAAKRFVHWFGTEVLDKIFGEGFSASLEDLLDDWKQLFADIGDLFDAFISGDEEKMKKAVGNLVRDLLNIIIDNINFTVKWVAKLARPLVENFMAPFFAIAKKIPGGEKYASYDALVDMIPKIPKIPRLATGAVIPGGSPFLAMLGDQRRGQTNIEAPLDTLVEAIQRAMSGQQAPSVTIEATGSMGALVRLLSLKVKEEGRRASVWGV